MSDYATEQTLYIWSCLERARTRTLPYKDDTAEIYVQRLLPQDYNASTGKTLWKQAGKNLYSILSEFCKSNNVSAIVNGKTMGEWLNDYELNYKCDVKIVRKI
jgi:hypothetical protein